MDQSNDKRIFYQEFRPSLTFGFILSVIGVFYCILMLKVFASNLTFVAIFAVVLLFCTWQLAVNVFMIVRILREPMLILDPCTFAFRGIEIPWTMISIPALTHTRMGGRLGIVLDTYAQQYVADRLTSKRSTQRMFLWYMKRYGAILVAPAKDADLSDLRAIFERYRVEQQSI